MILEILNMKMHFNDVLSFFNAAATIEIPDPVPEKISTDMKNGLSSFKKGMSYFVVIIGSFGFLWSLYKIIFTDELMQGFMYLILSTVLGSTIYFFLHT